MILLYKSNKYGKHGGKCVKFALSSNSKCGKVGGRCENRKVFYLTSKNFNKYNELFILYRLNWM